MCHDSGSSQLAGLKTLISSPQDRQFSAASQSRLDTSRFPRAARLSGRLSLSISHPSPPRSHSLFGSKERGKPHPPPVTTGPRPTRKCRFAPPVHGTTHPDNKAAVPSGNPSSTSPHSDTRQQTSLLQEGNWSRSSARVCSQAKIRWYGHLGEPGNTAPRFTPLGSARVVLHIRPGRQISVRPSKSARSHRG